MMNTNSIARRALRARGQALVEFAIIATIAVFVLFLGIQFALLGQAALAVGQLSYQGARYAAINPTSDGGAVKSFMLSVASPTIGSNGGSHLTISVGPAPPRTWGSAVNVTVDFDARGLILLPNPFFGIAFPTTLSSTQSAMTE